jgi:hypothetical protein
MSDKVPLCEYLARLQAAATPNEVVVALIRANEFVDCPNCDLYPVDDIELLLTTLHQNMNSKARHHEVLGEFYQETPTYHPASESDSDSDAELRPSCLAACYMIRSSVAALAQELRGHGLKLSTHDHALDTPKAGVHYVFASTALRDAVYCAI